jgi:hypothetical protein
MVDWTRAEGNTGEAIDCRGCRHCERNMLYRIGDVVFCTEPRVLTVPGQKQQACSMARSPGGRCGPSARLRDTRARVAVAE